VETNMEIQRPSSMRIEGYLDIPTRNAGVRAQI
jgi:hypothetical protein